jgi:hypothetical protein
MAPVVLGAIVATLAVYFLGRIHPLHGTGMALVLANSASLLAGIVVSYRTLPVRWPVKRMCFALLLCIPMIIGLRLGARTIPEFTIFQAVIMLLAGGGYFIAAEYFMARHWISKLAKGSS